MPHNENPVQVDLAVQWMGGSVIPGSKLFEVLEVNDRSPVVLAEVPSVEEVHVDRRGDNPMRRQQLAEIQVSGSGILERTMISMREYGERERASSTGHANMAIERHVRVGKWPSGAKTKIGERRNVDATRDIRGIRRIVDHILAQWCRVRERRRAIDDGVELRGAGECGIIQDRHFRSFVVLEKKVNEKNHYQKGSYVKLRHSSVSRVPLLLSTVLYARPPQNGQANQLPSRTLSSEVPSGLVGERTNFKFLI
ncbi:MAG TPA: hypothetical protein VGL29_17355 [Blastocatellia bacterium]